MNWYHDIMTEDNISQQKIIMPTFGDTDDKVSYNLEEIMESLNKSGQIADYNDMESIHIQINAARMSLFRITMAQSDADKNAVIEEQKYKRVWNRMYIAASGTDKIKTTTADIKSEAFQNSFLRVQMRQRELARRAQFLRDELRVLESLSNDYRQIIRSQQ